MPQKKLKEIFQKRIKGTFLLIGFLLFSSISFSYAADINLSPITATYPVGKNFIVDVMISKNQDNINAVSSEISFPADLLQVVSISKTDSIFNVWPKEPSFSNQKGLVSIEGVSVSSGFSASSGKIVTINFKALKSGPATISFKSGAILVNDGKGTNVLNALGSATFTIENINGASSDISTPAITSPTHPDSDKWYSSRKASFNWVLPSDVLSVRTLYDQKDSSTPNKVYTPPISNKSFTVDEDGITYMHVQFKTMDGWGSVGHYKFKIDTQAPKITKFNFPDGDIVTNETPSVFLTAEDSLSGVDHLTFNIDNEVSNSYTILKSNLYNLPKQQAGKHSVLVTVFDRAGNTTSSVLNYTILPVNPPTIIEYSKEIDTRGFITVNGKTYPNTKVEAVIERRHSSGMYGTFYLPLNNYDYNIKDYKDVESFVSNDNGDFNFVWPKNVDSGIYELKLRAINSRGDASDYTYAEIIIVNDITLIRIGMFMMSWLSFIFLIIVACIVIFGTMWYLLTQFFFFRKKVYSTVREAENTLKTNVVALRRDLEDFRASLFKAQKKRELTKEEGDLFKKLNKRLEIVEKEIEEKLEKLDK